MPNLTGAARAVCPFYKWEKNRSIACEGVIPGTLSENEFESVRGMREYHESMCSSFSYDACPHARAVGAGYFPRGQKGSAAIKQRRMKA